MYCSFLNRLWQGAKRLNVATLKDNLLLETAMPLVTPGTSLILGRALDCNKENELINLVNIFILLSIA